MLPIRLSALALLAALSACGEEAADGPERKTAAGEVLGGSISDAMLPLDTVQSQSPPLRETRESDSEASGDDRRGNDTDEAEPTRAVRPASPPTAEASASPAADEE